MHMQWSSLFNSLLEAGGRIFGEGDAGATCEPVSNTPIHLDVLVLALEGNSPIIWVDPGLATWGILLIGAAAATQGQIFTLADINRGSCMDIVLAHEIGFEVIPAPNKDAPAVVEWKAAGEAVKNVAASARYVKVVDVHPRMVTAGSTKVTIYSGSAATKLAGNCTVPSDLQAIANQKLRSFETGATSTPVVPKPAKLARCGRQRGEELRLVLSLGVPDEGGSARFAEPLVHASPVPDARLGLCEQRTPPVGRAFAAHALQRADALQFAPKEGALHSQALPTTLFASGCAWVWKAIFYFTFVFGLVLGYFFFFFCLFFFFGLAFGSTRFCTSERADGAARILLVLQLGGTTASDVDRCECPLLQRLLGFCLIVTFGAFGANLWCTYAAGLCRCARMAMCFPGVAIGVSNRWANSRRSSTASRRSCISSKRSWSHVACLFVAGLGSCGASDLTPGAAFADKTSLAGALSEWCADMTDAEATHGSVSTWDVSLVTDMQSLISNAPCCSTFDEDVNAWDVGQATSMQVRRRPLWGMGVA